MLTVSELLPFAIPFNAARHLASVTARLEPVARDRQTLKGCVYEFAILVTCGHTAAQLQSTDVSFTPIAMQFLLTDIDDFFLIRLR